MLSSHSASSETLCQSQNTVGLSNTVAIDFGRALFGPIGGVIFAAMVAFSCFGALNGTCRGMAVNSTRSSPLRRVLLHVLAINLCRRERGLPPCAFRPPQHLPQDPPQRHVPERSAHDDVHPHRWRVPIVDQFRRSRVVGLLFPNGVQTILARCSAKAELRTCRFWDW